MDSPRPCWLGYDRAGNPVELVTQGIWCRHHLRYMKARGFTYIATTITNALVVLKNAQWTVAHGG